MTECMGPWCSLLIEDGDEPFCSSRCELQFDEWSAELGEELAEPHNTHWQELVP